MQHYGCRIVLVAVLSALGSACMRAPTVGVTGVNIAGIGLSGITLMAELDVDNPNRFALETDSITFVFEAGDPATPGDWTPVTNGTHSQRFRVEKGSTASVEIPIRFGYSGLSRPIRAIIENGTLSYRVTGEVFVRRPLRKRVPFGEEGRLSVTTNSR